MTCSNAEADRLTQLLAAVRGGDPQAFAQLYEDCGSRLFGQLLRILQRRDWAEEALQDCFLKVWQKSETYEPARGAPLAWLSTIARYRALDLLRMKHPEVELREEGESPAASLFDPGRDPVDGAIEGQGIGRLHDCMRCLRDEQRRCVLLAYYQGYTYQEVAQAMNAPLGTVKSWARRGLSLLRDCMEDRAEG